MDDPKAALAVLVLFPTTRMVPLERFLVDRGYEPSVVGLAPAQPLGPAASSAEEQDGGCVETTPVFITVTGAGDLQHLPPEIHVRLLRPQLVLLDVGTDLLAPKVEGEGADWHVDPASSGGIKAEALSWLLDHLRCPSRTLWVNVFAGEHEARGPAHYCSGRYGLAGFEAAVRMSSRLRSMPLVNICLTYFADSGGEGARCAHCLTERHAAAIRAEGSDREAVIRYLERRYRQECHPTDALRSG